jgi:hypothetical protein
MAKSSSELRWKLAHLLVPVVVGVVLVPTINSLFSRKLELLRPQTAEETLRRETRVKLKSDAYNYAIWIMSRRMAATAVHEPKPQGPPPGKTTEPSEGEVSIGRAKLRLYADSANAIAQYDSFFGDTPDAAQTLSQFIQLGRADTGCH